MYLSLGGPRWRPTSFGKKYEHFSFLCKQIDISLRIVYIGRKVTSLIYYLPKTGQIRVYSYVSLIGMRQRLFCTSKLTAYIKILMWGLDSKGKPMKRSPGCATLRNNLPGFITIISAWC